MVFTMQGQFTILQVLQAQFNTLVQHLCRILSHKPIITLYFRWLHVKVLLINFTVCCTKHIGKKKFLFCVLELYSLKSRLIVLLFAISILSQQTPKSEPQSLYDVEVAFLYCYLCTKILQYKNTLCTSFQCRSRLQTRVIDLQTKLLSRQRIRIIEEISYGHND